MSLTSVAWRALIDRRIYFGHQSVGQNILDGIATLCAAAGVPVRLAEDDAPSVFENPVFAHSRLGKNRDPLSKIDAFAGKMQNGIGNRADIALFKLCYVDVTATTDVSALFRYYAESMRQLKSEYPRTLLAHVTVPLTTSPTRWRRLAGQVLNRPAPAIADNMARSHFNGLMRTRYGGNEPLFDLAKWETRGNDGALDRRLSSDGGHLNDRGSALLGGALLDFLCAPRALIVRSTQAAA